MPEVVANTEAARDNINGEREIPISAWHKAFVIMLQVLGPLLQLRYQGEIITIFQSKPKLVFTFLIVLYVYSATTLASYEPALRTYRSKLNYMSFVLGALTITLLLFMLEPFLGWMGFGFWVIIFFVVAARQIYIFLCESVYRKVEEFLNYLRTVIGRMVMRERHQLPL